MLLQKINMIYWCCGSGDGTPSYVWAYDGWRNTSVNRGLSEPKYFTPHYIKHFTPKAKFIVIMRNPTERWVLIYLSLQLYLRVNSVKSENCWCTILTDNIMKPNIFSFCVTLQIVLRLPVCRSWWGVQHKISLRCHWEYCTTQEVSFYEEHAQLLFRPWIESEYARELS